MDILAYIVDRALILIPVLNILGMILKNTEKVSDKFIPLILLVFGILGAIALSGFSADIAFMHKKAAPQIVRSSFCFCMIEKYYYLFIFYKYYTIFFIKNQ